MKVPWFPIAVLLLSALVGSFLVTEGFVGNVSAEDVAKMEARLADELTQYDQGSKGGPSAGQTALLTKARDAACSTQIADCAATADGKSQMCCARRQGMCDDATTAYNASKAALVTAGVDPDAAIAARIALIKANENPDTAASLGSDVKDRLFQDYLAKIVNQNKMCVTQKNAACAAGSGTDVQCCAASKKGCQEATAAVTSYSSGKYIPSTAAKPPPGPAPLVNQPGYLSTDDDAARAYGESIQRNSNSNYYGGFALPASDNPGTSLGYGPSRMYSGDDLEFIQRMLMKSVPSSQSSLSSASPSLLMDMPLADALSQGSNYNRMRILNGNTLPEPTDVPVCQGGPVAVQVGKYPFPTGSDDNGCGCN